MKNIPWDLYQIFLTVARQNGLTGAAKETGLSPATLGRKILELEHLSGEGYFARSQTGYTLTPKGIALFNELQDMEAVARKLTQLHGETRSMVTVRIASGTWNGAFMIDHIAHLCTEVDPFRLHFHISEERARLLYREADIGFRAFAPDEPNLATQKLPSTAYAIYRSKNARVPSNRWVAVSEKNAISTYLRWPHENRTGKIAMTANRAVELRDLIASGAGLGVLPCICGDRAPGLERVEALPEIQHEQWLVMNREDRHRREIRTVIDRISKLFKRHADITTGSRL